MVVQRSTIYPMQYLTKSRSDIDKYSNAQISLNEQNTFGSLRLFCFPSQKNRYSKKMTRFMSPLLLVASLLLITTFALAQDTVQLLQADVYLGRTSCTGPDLSVPFGVDGACNTFGDALSWKINYTDESREVFTTRDCSGSADSRSFQCIAGVDSDDVDIPATSFSCKAFSNKRVVIMTLSTETCPSSTAAGSALGGIIYSYALIVNTCLPIPQRVVSNAEERGIGHYEISVAQDGTIKFSRYADFLCLTEPKEVIIGKKNECTTVTGGGGASRLLQASSLSVSFETVNPDGELEVGSGSSMLSANLAILFATLFMGILSVF